MKYIALFTQRALAFLGGAIAWTLHLMLCYWIGEAGCQSGWDVTFWVILVTVFASFIAAAAIVSAYFLSQTDAREIAFLGRTGLMMNSIFLMVILVQVMPLFFLSECRSFT